MIGPVLAIALFAQSVESPRLPKPEDYPVSPTFSGTPAAPKFATPAQRRFRTVIRAGAKKGPNFAGHYAIVEWGCGAGCVQIAVVNVQSGNVYDGPFGVLFLGANSDVDQTGLFYRRESALFVAKGCPNEKDGGAYYYQWTGAQFRLLRKVPIKGLVGCEN